MCVNSALTLLLCVAAPASATAPGALPDVYSHFHPAGLNEAAVASVAAGDLGTAEVLLERAALLAPHDRVLAANLAQLRAARGQPAPVVLRSTSTPPAPQVTSGPAPPQTETLPAIWPRKQVPVQVK